MRNNLAAGGQEVVNGLKETFRLYWEAIPSPIKKRKNWYDIGKIIFACFLNVYLGNSSPWVTASLTGASVLDTYINEQKILRKNTERLRNAQKALKQKPSEHFGINWPTYAGLLIGIICLVFYYFFTVDTTVESSSWLINSLIIAATALPSLARKSNVSYIHHRAVKLEDNLNSRQALEEAERLLAIERMRQREEEEKSITLDELQEEQQSELLLAIKEMQNLKTSLDKKDEQLDKTNNELLSINNELIITKKEFKALEQQYYDQQKENFSTQQQLQEKTKELILSEQNLAQVQEELQKYRQNFESLQVRLASTEQDLDSVKLQLEEERTLRLKTQSELTALKVSHEKFDKDENKNTPPRSTASFFPSPKSDKIVGGTNLAKGTSHLESAPTANEKEAITKLRRNTY